MAAITHSKENIRILDGYYKPATASAVKPARKDYALFSFVILFVLAISIIYSVVAGEEGIGEWAKSFMGISLIAFGFLKASNLYGFIGSFKTYDLLAKQYPNYAKIYPFLEIALGLILLFDIFTPLTSLIALALSAVGAVGIITEIQAGTQFSTQNAHDRIKLPHSTVSLTENILIAALAILYIV